MSLAYLNGDYVDLANARVSVLDRGFLFADGVYEVIPVYRGKIFEFQAHLIRLQKSLDALSITFDVEAAQIENIIDRLLKTNQHAGHAKIYLQITRGAGPDRKHSFNTELKPTLFVYSSDLVLRNIKQLTIGEKAILEPDIRWDRCDIKSISLLPNILLTQKAQHQGANEAILYRNDYITEGASSNVYCVKNQIIYTPALSHQILGGITRQVVLELARKNTIKVQETDISVDFLKQADEIWISSATREILPITQLDDQVINHGQAGKLWQQMISHYHHYIENY